jgi:chromosome segregation ATPase
MICYITVNQKEFVMGRTGITYFDVSNAIATLQGQQKNPTVDSIREELGTGSRSTISKYFQEWKTKNGIKNATETGIPIELQNLIQSLWEKIQADADTKIEKHQVEADAEINDTKNQLAQSELQNATLQSEIQSLSEKLKLQIQITDTLKNDLSNEKNENIKLGERIAALESQNTTHKSENDRLHQLLKNTQDNLVHYQKAVEAQRQEQMMLLEKQRADYESRLIQFHNLQLILTQEKTAAESKNDQLNYSFKTLKNDFQSLQKNLHKLDSEKQQLQMHYNQLQLSFENNVMQSEKQAVDINIKNQEITDLKIKNGVFENQLNQTKEALLALKNEYQDMRDNKNQLEQKLNAVIKNKNESLVD